MPYSANGRWLGQPYPKLAFPTADNTVIVASTINFTADGADLINGGGMFLAPFRPVAVATINYPIIADIRASSTVVLASATATTADGADITGDVLVPNLTHALPYTSRRRGLADTSAGILRF